MEHPSSRLPTERYISFTSYKRDGQPVDVPVWVADDDGQLLFTTPASSFKVKRLSRNPAVAVRPCDMRGRVAPDAPRWTGTAEVVTDPDRVAAAHRAVGAKYGIQHTLTRLAEKVRRVVKRVEGGDAAIHLHLDDG